MSFNIARILGLTGPNFKPTKPTKEDKAQAKAEKAARKADLRRTEPPMTRAKEVKTPSQKRPAESPSQKRPAGNPAYLRRVRQLPCVICETFGEPQLSQTAAHHVIHNRGSQRKTDDTRAIPLCEGHHQGLIDRSKIALHHSPAAWRAAYGEDTTYTERTRKALNYHQKE